MGRLCIFWKGYTHYGKANVDSGKAMYLISTLWVPEVNETNELLCALSGSKAATVGHD